MLLAAFLVLQCQVAWVGLLQPISIGLGLLFGAASSEIVISHFVSFGGGCVCGSGERNFLLYAVFLKSLATSLEYFTMFLKRDLVEHF